jgi:hypothetical protein
MITKLLIYAAAIAINLYVAQKKGGRMKRTLQIAAGVWVLLGILDITGVLSK